MNNPDCLNVRQAIAELSVDPKAHRTIDTFKFDPKK
jgi:hypothetical protein